MKKSALFFCVFNFFVPLLILGQFAVAQPTTFQLSNGLTVIVNEDHQTPTIFGNVVVRAGSVDEPADATGLAHYLEHVMFKGSSNVGTTNWEKEQMHYQNIINLYDQLREAPEAERAAIQKKINEESILAGQYTINNEFSNLIQSIGGTSLNASTGYEMTQYFNVFPSYQLKKWLELNVDRFSSPVYRGFQAELETVYEEKNMYSDNPFSVLSEEFSRQIYGAQSVYGRSIIGETEHLKTPSLRKLIEFYQTYYVPANMALVLSGDVNAEAVKPLLEATFGGWTPANNISRKPIEKSTFNTKTVIKKNITPIPVLMMGYKGAATTDEDSYVLEMIESILSNRSKTGLLDRLVIDNDLMQVQVGLDQRKFDGAIQILGVPTFDVAQMRFTSLSTVESIIVKTLDELKQGKVDDWLIQAVKDNLMMDYEMMKESNLSVGMALSQIFANSQPLDDFTRYAERIKAVDKEQIIAVANKYFTSGYLSLQSQKGKPAKDELVKPEYKPIEPAKGATSAFAKAWMSQAVADPTLKAIDFANDVACSELNPGVTFYHTQNSANDIFSMTIKYGVGTELIPGLKYSVELMNRAGVMAQLTAYEVKKEFSRLGCVVNFAADKSYTYITMRGKEASLAKACQLLAKNYLMPALDEKQMNSLLGNELSSRSIEGDEKDIQGSALNEYMRYGTKSSYLNRLTQQEILQLTVSKLAADFIKATQYETSVHYTGRFDAGVVKNVLLKNLAFPSNLQAGSSPYVTPLADYKENTILLFNNKDARQTDVYLFAGGDTFTLSQESCIDAFNQYFGGGFSGLVMQELRELRSFAYTASANYITPALPDHKGWLSGYIGVQKDKTNDAISEFIKLIQEMPAKPERMDNIKQYLYQATISATPSLRNKSMLVENWKRLGYSADPRIQWLGEYQAMTFDDILKFYHQSVQPKPVVIGIVGDVKSLDQNKLKSFGKVINVNTKTLFKY